VATAAAESEPVILTTGEFAVGASPVALLVAFTPSEESSDDRGYASVCGRVPNERMVSRAMTEDRIEGHHVGQTQLHLAIA
jgi:hypothetical protein